MAEYFLDSSAFTKRYKREIGTDFINTLFVGGHRLFYLNLAILEVRKVFYRLRHNPQSVEGDLQTTDVEFLQAQNQFAADILPMERIALTEEMIAYSETILENHWINSAFDLAHLSAFLIIKQEHPGMILVTADRQMCDVGRILVPASDVINPDERV